MKRPHREEMQDRAPFLDKVPELDRKKTPKQDPALDLDLALLRIIYTQIPRYPNMLDYVVNEKIVLINDLISNPGILKLKQDIEGNPEFAKECYTFMDTLNLLEALHYGTKPYSIIDTMIVSIMKNRDNALNTDGIDLSPIRRDRPQGLLFYEETQNDEELHLIQVLGENKVIVGFYIYSLVVKFFGADVDHREKLAILNTKNVKEQ